MWLNFKNSKYDILNTLSKKSGIYMLLCNVNNKCYIGSSSNLRKRMVVYYNLNMRAKDTRIISRALTKHGEENFSLIILDYCSKDVSVLLELEQLALDLWLPEYNIYKIAGSPLGFTHSDETRALISSKRQGEDNKFYGKTHSQEVKNLLSVLNTGEGHPNFGKKRSLETVNKMITSSSYRAKQVFCYSWEDRFYICSYPSVSEMARSLNLVRGTIQYAIKNKTPLKTINGPYFVSYTDLDQKV